MPSPTEFQSANAPVCSCLVVGGYKRSVTLEGECVVNQPLHSELYKRELFAQGHTCTNSRSAGATAKATSSGFSLLQYVFRGETEGEEWVHAKAGSLRLYSL
ncbi:unnamed protein product [Ixodes pacificus]